MKHSMKKILLTTTASVVIALCAPTARAAFQPFTVAEGSVAGTAANTFEAGKLTGNYVEDVTVNRDGTFNTSLLFNAGTFGDLQGGTISNSFLTSARAPFSAPGQYGVYVTLTGNGTYVTSASGTLFTFTPGGKLTLSVDPTNDTTFSGINVTGDTANDYMIGQGLVTGGEGTLRAGCVPTNSINCGSFGTNTSFALTTQGERYFTQPRPFYGFSLESGQFDFIDVNNFGTQRTTGSLDAVFVGSGSTTDVPEPGSVALLGIGLLGLAVGLRQRARA